MGIEEELERKWEGICENRKREPKQWVLGLLAWHGREPAAEEGVVSRKGVFGSWVKTVFGVDDEL